ncbi:hypothetical protein [Vibrio coralliilyticus]|uniref:hypothetical protein n=1 Tax=Vibrio coralliilyticus TaxID=190893 RepID=UPI00179084B2|nr:hypothetical protein [Vibrio coralliilyticus]NUW69537.1 hypothetical protein [Vibrio coralliilyticus]
MNIRLLAIAVLTFILLTGCGEDVDNTNITTGSHNVVDSQIDGGNGGIYLNESEGLAMLIDINQHNPVMLANLIKEKGYIVEASQGNVIHKGSIRTSGKIKDSENKTQDNHLVIHYDYDTVIHHDHHEARLIGSIDEKDYVLTLNKMPNSLPLTEIAKRYDPIDHSDEWTIDEDGTLTVTDGLKGCDFSGTIKRYKGYFELTAESSQCSMLHPTYNNSTYKGIIMTVKYHAHNYLIAIMQKQDNSHVLFEQFPID